MESKLRYEYDRDVGALYIYLSDKLYSYGRDLDAERRVDYAEDGTPIGVELTCVRSGVNVDDLPAAARIMAILHDLDIPSYA